MSLILIWNTWALVGAGGVAYLALGIWPVGGADLSPIWRWGLALGTLLVYSAGLVLAETVRTPALGLFTPLHPRGVYLFPFGAAAAYPLRTPSMSRALLATVAAPLVLAGLGLGYRVASMALAGTSLGLLVEALATANLTRAALHLLPGIPLAGGWLVAALVAWLTGALDQGVTLARRLGMVVLLALVGGAVILAGQGRAWDRVLGLLALAWMLREGRARPCPAHSTTPAPGHADRAGSAAPPAQQVAGDATLAQVMRGQGTLALDAVLAVTDPQGQFLGLLPVSRVEGMLQGTWGQTTIPHRADPGGSPGGDPADGSRPGAAGGVCPPMGRGRGPRLRCGGRCRIPAYRAAGAVAGLSDVYPGAGICGIEARGSPL